MPLPERPPARSFPEHLLARSSLEELESAARTMEREGSWYSALELHLEVLRRCEASDYETLDVTLYNRIADIHRLLAVEWYAEAADRYAERELRRGAIALCEKALRLDRDRPEVRRQLELLSGAPAPPAEPVRLPRGPDDAERPEPAPGPAREPEPVPGPAREPEPGPEPSVPTPEAPPAPEPQRPPGAAEGRPDADEEPLPRIVVPPSDEEYERLGRGQVVGACLVLVGVIVAILIWL